jgi:hypothetical protein
VTAQPAWPEPSSPQPSSPQQPYRVGLTKVSSFILYTQQRTTVYTGTLDELERQARSVLTHNLLLGWWGIPAGLIWTPIALARNGKNMRKIKALAAGPTDPAGPA